MDVERAIVTRVAQTSDLMPLLERSIEPHHFVQRGPSDTTPQQLPGEVYAWMIDHLRRYKSQASWPVIQVTFPAFVWWDAGSAIEPLIDMLHAMVMRRELRAGIRALSDLHDSNNQDDLINADVRVFDIAADLVRAVPSHRVSRLSDAPQRFDRYLEEERQGTVDGLSMVLPFLDNLTKGGVAGHELMIWLGFLGVGKSSIAMAQCAKAYLQDEPKNGMVFSLEMEGDELNAKWDSMMGKFSYDNMKRMQLTDDEKRRFEQYALKAADSRFERDIMVIDDLQNVTSSTIQSKMEQFRPDFVVVDTLDEIRAPSHLKTLWEQQAWAARELKGIARYTKKPVIAVAQAGRDAEEHGASLNNIAGSIDIARKADIIIGLHATPAMKQSKMMKISALKNRRGVGDGVSEMFYWDIGTMTFRKWQPSDNIATPPQQQQVAA